MTNDWLPFTLVIIVAWMVISLILKAAYTNDHIEPSKVVKLFIWVPIYVIAAAIVLALVIGVGGMLWQFTHLLGTAVYLTSEGLSCIR